MKSVIVHADGRRIDLADTISAEVYEELERTRSPRAHPVLFCGGCNGGIYIRHGSVRKDELFGAHHDRGECRETLEIRKTGMSDEHKRMAEYHVAAAVAEGLDADMEVITTGRTRVDVVVDNRIGFEVQRSQLSAAAAADRTGRSMAAGLESVAWVAEITKPSWLGRVPGYQWLNRGRDIASGMPSPRSVQSRGVITFRADRAGWRDEWVPVVEPLTILIDDAVTRMAAGNIRPVMYLGNVQLVREDGITLYEQMTGTPLAPFKGRSPVRVLAPSPPAECLRPPAPRRSPEQEPVMRTCQAILGDGLTLCDDEEVRPYENGAIWLCRGHAWQRYMSR